MNSINLSLEAALIIGFLFHLIGDYLTQNDWMASNKTKFSSIAALHAFIYSMPFIFIIHNPNGQINYYWLIIIVSHFFIDRYRLAIYWIKLVNWNWVSTNFGYDENKPAFMSIWLMIIVDNVFHLLFNSVSIYLSFIYPLS